MVFDLGPQRITRTAKTTFYRIKRHTYTLRRRFNTRNNKNIDLPANTYILYIYAVDDTIRLKRSRGIRTR